MGAAEPPTAWMFARKFVTTTRCVSRTSSRGHETASLLSESLRADTPARTI